MKPLLLALSLLVAAPLQAQSVLLKPFLLTLSLLLLVSPVHNLLSKG